MSSWLLFAILALIAWGLWGFFPKLATKYLDVKSIFIYELIGVAVIGIAVLAIEGGVPNFSYKGFIFAILTGAAGSLGALFFLFALKKGIASVVVALTALYPLISLVLLYLIIREPLTLKQALGIVFALVAMVLFSI